MYPAAACPARKVSSVLSHRLPDVTESVPLRELEQFPVDCPGDERFPVDHPAVHPDDAGSRADVFVVVLSGEDASRSYDGDASVGVTKDAANHFCGSLRQGAAADSPPFFAEGG